MFVREIQNIDRIPLRASDTVENGITAMEDQKSGTIAVIDFTTRRLIGEVLLDDLKKAESGGETVMAYLLKKPFVIDEHAHVMDAAARMMQARQDTAYLIDENNTYKGTLHIDDLMKPVFGMLSLSDQGTVIMLELPERDYMLGDLVRIVELEGGKILGIGVEPPHDDQRMFRVSLKMSQKDVTKVIHALNRYGYIITSETPTENTDEELHERADEFMRYLGI